MGKQWKQWKTILGGSKITADGDCCHEIKRHLLLVREDLTNLDSILESRDITLPTKIHLVKAMVFAVVVYIWKDRDAGKDWWQEEKGTTEDEMLGWHHWLDGHGFGWTLRIGDGQGGLACCSSWGGKKWTWLSNWTKLMAYIFLYKLILFSLGTGASSLSIGEHGLRQ